MITHPLRSVQNHSDHVELTGNRGREGEVTKKRWDCTNIDIILFVNALWHIQFEVT